jgi:thioredoxin reductase (NADPH)
LIGGHTIQRIVGTDAVAELALREATSGASRTIALDGVFVFIGFSPNGPRLFRDHIKHDGQCYIVTDSEMETSIPGVFAAGDTRAQLARQITTAVGDGTTAAIAAQHYIEHSLRRV